jgi:SAM-dependent methyltransferase
MREAIRKAMQKMRQAAVEDYRKCIFDCLEPTTEQALLLDCGCDDGEWTRQLGTRLGNSRLFGIELMEERRALAVQKGIDARQADLNDPFPFPDEAFDVVHANQVIEHITDTDHFIEEIRRVLKPGGYAVICTENLGSWHNIFSLFLGWQPFSLSNITDRRFQIGNPLAIHHGEAATNPKSWQHYRVFSYRGLKDVFEVHGFKVVLIEGSGYFPLPSSIAKLDPRHAAFLTVKIRKEGVTG